MQSHQQQCGKKCREKGTGVRRKIWAHDEPERVEQIGRGTGGKNISDVLFDGLKIIELGKVDGWNGSFGPNEN